MVAWLQRKAADSEESYSPATGERYRRFPFCTGFEWPSIEMVLKSQETYKQDAGSECSADETGLIRVKGKLWIPEKDADLQLKILVVAHCGTSGHRAVESTGSVIKESYNWATIDADCYEFVKSCLHCLTGRQGTEFPVHWQHRSMYSYVRLSIDRCTATYV